MASRAAPPSKARRAASLLLAGLVVLAFVVGALLMAGHWLLRSDDGLQWLLHRVPGLEADGVVGRIDGGPLEIARLQWRSGDARLTIDGLTWRDARWQWRPHPGAWLGIRLDQPRARRVEWVAAPTAADAPPTEAPRELTLPVELAAAGARVDRLQIGTQPPLADVQADLHLGADRGRTHRVSRLALRHPHADVSLAGSLGAVAPMALDARIELRNPPDAAQPWQVQARAVGTLARTTLDATLQAAAARVDARATLLPFAAWPLAELEASTRDLDLSTLASGWPVTKLSGRATVHTSGLDRPARIELDVGNGAPGRWDDARLPLRTLRAVVVGQPNAPDRLQFDAFDAELGGARAAGRVAGSGRWQQHRLALELRVDKLRPSLLDSRLPAMTLAGPLQLQASGLPSPDPAARASPAPHVAAELTATLDGRLDAPRGAPPVSLRAALALDAPPDALTLEVRQLAARAGAARAELSATARRDATPRWQLRGRGELVRFDPAPWWPALAAAARRGPAHNAAGVADRGGPADAPPRPATLGGRMALKLADSRLAGVPLGGELAWRSEGGGARLDATLVSQANRVALEGRSIDRATARWQVDVQAPALQALAPLAALVPALEPWWPQGGALHGRARADGRWPALRSDGELRIAGVRAAALRVERADARWSFAGLQGDAPLALTLDAAGVAHGEQRLDTVKADLAGSVRAHRLQLRAATPAQPPAWTDTLLGGRTAASGMTLRVDGDGSWRAEPDGAGRWSGALRELLVAARGSDAPPWVAARDLALQARIDRDGKLVEAAAEPGRVTLLGAALRWRTASWQAGAPARVALDAELEPLPLAPWLAKLQPHFGWGGDLTLAGRAQISGGSRFDADVVIERVGGDLSVTDEAGTQRLGLTDLRLALAAHDGVWHFTQALAGSAVGVLGGAQSLRVAPHLAWPPPATPLEGVVELRVAHLGVWAPWLPPGWRLSGQMRTSASLGGRFDAPEYTGAVVGSGLGVRNLLQGVDVRDGELAITLRGADATIERFRLRGGDGELRLDGGASFGATPRAQLRMVAERFQVLGRVDRRVVASGEAALALQAKQVRLDGRLAVDEGLIDVSQADAPKLDDDVVVVRRGAAQAPPPPEAPAAPLRNAVVSVVVDLGERLRLRGRGLDTTLQGQLRITSPDGRLAVNGTVRTESGTFAAYGEELLIERGTLVFTGPVENPRLDVLAVRADLDVRVGVAVSGTVVNPRVRLFSEPEMGEFEKLSWLVLGRASDGLGRTDTALLQRAALALITGPGGGGSGDALLKNIGLDELSVRQTEDGSVRDTVITVGKQLSRRWYVGYERSINATTGTWQLIYRIAQRFTLRAQGGADNSLDVIWTWRWD